MNDPIVHTSLWQKTPPNEAYMRSMTSVAVVWPHLALLYCNYIYVFPLFWHLCTGGYSESKHLFMGRWEDWNLTLPMSLNGHTVYFRVKDGVAEGRVWVEVEEKEEGRWREMLQIWYLAVNISSTWSATHVWVPDKNDFLREIIIM